MQTVDIAAVLEDKPIGRFQIEVFVLCAVACFTTGFNDLALGYVAPSVIASLHISTAELGPAFAVLGIGNVLGVLLCGPLADRVGRKPAIIIAMLASTPFVFAMAVAPSVPVLALFQLCASIGLMGLMPVALSLAGEYAARARKVTVVLIVFLGFALGTIVAGLVTASIINSLGWRAVFVINGLLMCVIAPVLMWRLPESLPFLLHRGGSEHRVASLISRLFPADADLLDGRLVNAETRERGSPVALLFRQGRARSTTLLWLMFFAAVMLVTVLNSWLTTILSEAGMTKRLAVILASVVNIGGLCGALVFALVYDRLRNIGFYLLGMAFFLGACFVAAIGLAHGSVPLVATFILLTGFFAYGALATSNAVAATLYPISMRSTGGAWAIGIGQIARTIGPPIAGVPLSFGWNEAQMLTLIAAPGFVAAFAAMLTAIHTRRERLSRLSS